PGVAHSGDDRNQQHDSQSKAQGPPHTLNPGALMHLIAIICELCLRWNEHFCTVRARMMHVIGEFPIDSSFVCNGVVNVLYSLHEMSHAALAPLKMWASMNANMFKHPFSP